MGTTKGGDDLNDQVRKIIEEAIGSLVAIGCSHQTALSLLAIQAGIRMRDGEEIEKLREFFDGLSPLDADDE